MKALALIVGVILLWSDAVLADGILIIANPSTQITTLSAEQVTEIYLLKTVSWPDGGRIIPVNRETPSETRARFNATVLKQDNAELSAYWNQMHFKGKMPPVIQESDSAMLAFVQRVPGSIGYVAASTPVNNVKIIGRVP